MKTAPETTSLLKNLALEMGFDVVGVTVPKALREGEEAIRAWTEEKRHGTMKYLEDFEARRNRFYQDFPDAKSVIVLGVNYYSNERITRHPEEFRRRRDDEGSRDSSSRSSGTQNDVYGRVARYAWGKDYHQVIRKKHELLIERLNEIFVRARQAVPLRFQSCVDTQPLPERFAAKQAGLGFIGKHTGLLSQKFGPWLFLSEIVTNLELEEDMPSEGNCGTCVHCQKICPTGALDEDYKIDAKKCIAYLTIEHKGVIARELRPKIKNWLFGCDECLAICPFTSKQKEGSWPELKASAGFGEWIDLKELFEIPSNAAYERKFFGTALMRVSRKQMLRNACLVLGNIGRENPVGARQAVPLLMKALRDPASLVRLHAAWALGQLPFEEAKKALKRHQPLEEDTEVLREIRSSLTQACTVIP